MNKRLAAVLFLLAVPALAHAPYDSHRFSGAGASGSWGTPNPLTIRGNGHTIYTEGYDKGSCGTVGDPAASCSLQGGKNE